MPDHTPPQAANHEPLSSQLMDVGNGHALYVETVGCEGGIPAVYLHGGPGSGCQPDHRKLFDPQTFQAVLFDQRGCGRSTPKGLGPKGAREANTTQHLVADMEAIRARFGFERWLVVGGSWGATLALAYAQTHPERVSGLVLRATFLGTRAELDGAFRVMLPRLYPGLHADFLGMLPQDERDAPLAAYYKRILDPDPNVHGPFARAWAATERILSEHAPGQTRFDRDAIATSTRPLPTTPFMEAHYFLHDCFLEDGQLMHHAHRLRGIPGIIVQGRYDLLCPPQTSDALAARWPDAEVRVIPAAGHSLYDPGIRDAVKLAIAELGLRQK